jgi:hypothetical protein
VQQNFSNLNPRQREMFKLMLLQMIMQQQRGGGAPQAPKASQVDEIINYVKKAKGAYEDGKNLYSLGESVYNYFAGPAYSQASQAAWNQAAGQASQQAWNAGADVATNASQGVGSAAGDAGSSSASGPSSMDGSYAAAVFSALNSGRRFMGTSRDEQKAYEASMAVPRALAAYYTFGGSEMLEGFARKQWGGTMKKFDKLASNPLVNPIMGASKLWTSDKWKTEGNRLKGLIEKGIEIPEQFRAAMNQTRGRKKSELINPYLPQDFKGETPQYGWVNNKFANSRNESDLTARDIWGYSTFFEKFGNDWLGKMNEKQREAIANKALQRGAVREHHGTVDINWTPELEADIAAIRGPNMIPKAQPGKPQPTQPQTPPTTQPVQAANVNRKGILGRLR